MEQAGVVHEQRQDLVVLVLVRERAVGVEAPQRARAGERVGHQERQLDDRTAGKLVALGAAQAERDVDGADLDLVRLLGRLAERRRGIEDFDLHLAIGLGLQLLRPRLDRVDLKEAGRPEEVAEFERDRLGYGGGSRRDHHRRSKRRDGHATVHTRPPSTYSGVYRAWLLQRSKWVCFCTCATRMRRGERDTTAIPPLARASAARRWRGQARRRSRRHWPPCAARQSARPRPAYGSPAAARR